MVGRQQRTGLWRGSDGGLRAREAAGTDDVVADPVATVDSMTHEEAADAEFARWEEKRGVARVIG